MNAFLSLRRAMMLQALQLFLVVTVYAGDEVRLPGTWGVSGRISYGFLIAHREALMPLQEAHLGSAEFSLFRLPDGKNPWEQQFRLPEKGVQLEVIRPGTQKLGTAVALYPFVDFPLAGCKDRSWWFRYGLGIGYVTNTFDPVDNYKNAAVGSHLNGVLHLDVQYRGRLGPRSGWEAGIGLTHFSNGSVKMPNLGVNFPKVNIGYRKFIGEERTADCSGSSPSPHDRYWQVYIAGAVKETYPALGPKYAAGTFNVQHVFPGAGRSRFGLGADFFYDGSVSVRYERLNGVRKSSSDFRPGIYGSWSMPIGDLAIGFNLGYYPYSLYKEDGAVYHRVTLQYHFKRLFLCTNLKTHYARADFIEWGVGWRLQKRKAS